MRVIVAGRTHESEVDEKDAARRLFDQDVGRLHVPVQKAVRVDCIESRSDLLDHLHCSDRFKRPSVSEQIPEVLLDVTHHDVETVLVLAEVVHRYLVVVIVSEADRASSSNRRGNSGSSARFGDITFSAPVLDSFR